MDNIEIKTVKLISEGRGYLVNNTLSFLIKDNNELLTYVNEWIKDGGLVEPEFTSEELTAQELNEKISTANQYLAQTDWVNAYKIRHDLGLDIIPESSSKWEVVNKREEYIVFLKAIEGAK